MLKFISSELLNDTTYFKIRDVYESGDVRVSYYKYDHFDDTKTENNHEIESFNRTYFFKEDDYQNNFYFRLRGNTENKTPTKFLQKQFNRMLQTQDGY
jgi:hypothetical protein